LSTFTGLSTALSSLYAQRQGMDITGQNIANANTDGYSRQRVDLEAVGGSPVPAMYSVSTGAGQGVTIQGVERVQDSFLEARGRVEHAQNSYLADQNQMYTEVQQALNEPSDTGVQSQLSDMWSSWHDLANSPGDSAVRTQVLARATTLTDTLHSTSQSFASLFQTTREQVDSYVTDINTTATQVASLNQAVVRATNAGLPSNELADQRDKLVMHLAEAAGATALPLKDGSVSVYLGGSNLVYGANARQISASGAQRLADIGTSPVTVSWTDNGGAVSTQSGTLTSMTQTLNTVIPHYSSQLDGVAANLASAVNAAHVAGYDKAGNPGTNFFVSSDGGPVTASTITVGIANPDLVAAATTTAGAGGGTLDGGNADAIAAISSSAGGPDHVYRQMIADLGVAGQAADRQATIQSSLTGAVDSARQAQSGVNLDEEMTNLISFQRAFEAASKVINTVDSSLDTIINHMGVG